MRDRYRSQVVGIAVAFGCFACSLLATVTLAGAAIGPPDADSE